MYVWYITYVCDCECMSYIIYYSILCYCMCMYGVIQLYLRMYMYGMLCACVYIIEL